MAVLLQHLMEFLSSGGEGPGEKFVSDNDKCIRTSEGVGVLTSE